MNSIRQYSLASTQRQRGLSLVELLVALVISLFLIVGVIQLFIGSKQTYRFHDALSRVQENGRFALEAMARDIRMAGYQYPGSSGSPAIVGSGNDNITVRWTEGGTQTRTYSIVGSALNQNRGSGNQELVEGVQAMRILYGICADANGDGQPDGPVNPPYVDATAVTAANNWDRVCGVRIHLLLVSTEANIFGTNQTVVFPPGSGTSVTVADRRLPQIFSTTVGLRNRLLF